MTKRKTAEPRLTAVRDTRGGEEYIGCRATGTYRGHRIEKTAWVPVANAHMVIFSGELERLARGRYEQEKRMIDAMTTTGQC